MCGHRTMASSHVTQVLREIHQIACEVLNDKNISVTHLNNTLHDARRRHTDQAYFLPDPSMFHRDPQRVGVLTREKAFEYIFDSQTLMKYRTKITIIVYWKAWFWFGTYRDVTKTLQAFLKEMKDKQPSEEMSCCVCMESSELQMQEYVFRCNHLFCSSCVPKLASDKTRVCPLCRSSLL